MYQKSQKHLSNLALARQKAQRRIPCRFCGILRVLGNIQKHESSCYLHPKNLTPCDVCGQPIKHFQKNAGTCSHACSNKKFKRTKNPKRYTTICFRHHEKKCVICGEQKIVEVHHLDENKNNNDPSNLVPLCPTHHQYWHSKHKILIESGVHEYMKIWSRLRDSNPRPTVYKTATLPLS